MTSLEERTKKVGSLIGGMELSNIIQSKDDAENIKIENFIGYCKVPTGVAGPLRVNGLGLDCDITAPLATYEPTLVASCSRGCKAISSCGGVHAEVISDGMSRAPVFVFDSPEAAVAFVRSLPGLETQFAQWAESTSRYIRFQEIRGTVIGSQAHVFCYYHCGDAAGQNMVTKATKFACDMLQKFSVANSWPIRDFFIEGQMASDKKPSWGNITRPRGVEVLAWATINDSTCREVLGCSTNRLYQTQMTLKEGGIRNGQFGCNINTANVIAAMFISTGQDPGSVAEASWSHLTSEYDSESKMLTMSLYFPSLPVGTVGGGTAYKTQQEALSMLRCEEAGAKGRLAGLVASFALALDASTSAAIANDTFTASHMKLARGEMAASSRL